MNMTTMMWIFLVRKIPRTASFLPGGSVPSLVNSLGNRQFSALPVPRRRNQRIGVHATRGSSEKKKGPKLNVKKDKHLLRADRVLANRGWGSRSECTALIKQKRVWIETSDGQRTPLKGPSERIIMDTPLWFDNHAPVPSLPLLMAFHKPKWVLSVLSDPQGRPNLGDLLSEVQTRQNLHPVGRLDYDTSGLILFSTNGRLTQKLLHPTHEIEKEYVALVEGTVDENDLAAILESGVATTEGVHTAQLLQVTHVDSTQVPVLLEQMKSQLPKEYNVTDLQQRGYLFDNCTALSKVRLKVSEGKHRMVRRVLANCGHGVVELKRERHGNVLLGDLPPGEFRNLTETELEWAKGLLAERKPKGRKE